MGQGQGLSVYVEGQITGVETVSLVAAQLPTHTHSAMAVVAGNQVSPQGNVWAGDSTGATALYSNGQPNVRMNAAALAPAGGNQPHSNIQPYTVVNFIIALQGLYPSRN